MKKVCFLAAWLLAPSLSAGGSLDTSVVMALLRHEPTLNRALAGLEFERTAVGTRLGQRVYPHLGGARTGPYFVRAREAKSNAPYDLAVVVCTTVTFLDSNREKTTDPALAVALEERVIGAYLGEEKQATLEPAVYCPPHGP